MNWKKRGRKGWTGKKFAKETTKSRERQYGNSEIKQQIQEDLEGDDFRYRGGKKKKNKIAKYQYWADYYRKRAIEEELKEEKGDYCSFLSSYDYKKRAKEYENKIEECRKKIL